MYSCYIFSGQWSRIVFAPPTPTEGSVSEREKDAFWYGNAHWKTVSLLSNGMAEKGFTCAYSWLLFFNGISIMTRGVAFFVIIVFAR